jgi:hypothetical protein
MAIRSARALVGSFCRRVKATRSPSQRCSDPLGVAGDLLPPLRFQRADGGVPAVDRLGNAEQFDGVVEQAHAAAGAPRRIAGEDMVEAGLNAGIGAQFNMIEGLARRPRAILGRPPYLMSGSA